MQTGTRIAWADAAGNVQTGIITRQSGINGRCLTVELQGGGTCMVGASKARPATADDCRAVADRIG